MLLGEDIDDPYGGAFKVTRGLGAKYPGRILSTPISEAAITGIAVGRAMRGLPTIVEIMFGDFLTLSVDQLLNHATKLSWVYNDQVEIPLVIRTPMGGGRGYGATHSQSLEKYFCGMPGLTVVAVNQYSDPGALLEAAVARRSPVLFVENKVLYSRFLETPLSVHSNPDITVVTYGGMVECAVAAAKWLLEYEEIVVNVLAVEQLWPLPEEIILREVNHCPAVLVLEEGTAGYGFGAECARVLANRSCRLSFVSALAQPIPNSRTFEENVLPSVAKVIDATINLFNAT